MQIQHPTASLIARASTAQDDMTGDGTTSTVLLIGIHKLKYADKTIFYNCINSFISLKGELLKQADIYISEGLHPRIVTEGFDAAREKVLEVLNTMKVPIEITKEKLMDIARTSLRTKVIYFFTL